MDWLRRWLGGRTASPAGGPGFEDTRRPYEGGQTLVDLLQRVSDSPRRSTVPWFIRLLQEWGGRPGLVSPPESGPRPFRDPGPPAVSGEDTPGPVSAPPPRLPPEESSWWPYEYDVHPLPPSAPSPRPAAPARRGIDPRVPPFRLPAQPSHPGRDVIGERLQELYRSLDESAYGQMYNRTLDQYYPEGETGR